MPSTHTTSHTPRSAARRSTPVARPGFSLLELTLVLLIIGLLGAVAAVNLVGAGERARVRTTKATMTQYKNQLKIYATDKGSYPANLSELVTGKYIEADNSGQPPSDGWDRPFYYSVTPGGTQEFQLISAGPDGENNTEDDINLWDPAFDS